MFNLSEPSQSTTNDWAFIDELKSELHQTSLELNFLP